MLIIVPLLAICCAPALWFVLGKPRFLPAAKSEKGGEKISIVIPARDEELSIGLLLDSLAEQRPKPYEIIVVDDGSQDGTAEIARAKGAQIVSPDLLPGDWKGKPWACQTGAAQATGDWLLFLDADLVFEPGGYAKVAELTQRNDRAYSVCPYHRIGSLAEEFSSFFNLIMVAGSNAFGWQKNGSVDAALFGQSLLISRQHYESVGGHEKVRDQVLENFHLASHLREQGVARECFLGKKALSMRMFPEGLGQLWSSWKKGFTSGAKQAGPRALILISIWLTGAMTVLTCLALAAVGFGQLPFLFLSATAYFVFVAQSWWAFRLVGSFSAWNALLFPLALLFYQTLFFTALIERAFGKKTQWKGRDVS